jgi:hypothetical protein
VNFEEQRQQGGGRIGRGRTATARPILNFDNVDGEEGGPSISSSRTRVPLWKNNYSNRFLDFLKNSKGSALEEQPLLE